MLRVGIDLVNVGRIAGSLEAFGARFVRRVFTAREAAYAGDHGPVQIERLAVRFAAKEAAKKALGLDGVGWTDIEVVREDSGAVALCLHGAARAAADAIGVRDVALSLSHEDNFATAVVVAQCERAQHE